MLCICYNILSILLMDFSDNAINVLDFFVDIFKFMLLYSLGALV